MADDLSSDIQDAAQGPKQVTSDGLTVQAHPLLDLVKADQYLKAQDAAAKKHRGLRFTRLLPPGAQ